MNLHIHTPRIAGDYHQIEELRQLEKLFANGIDFQKYYDDLVEYIRKKMSLSPEHPITGTELRQLDEFTRDYFWGKMSETQLWIVRGSVLATLIGEKQRQPLMHRAVIEIDKLPKTVAEASKAYNLSARDARSLEWVISDSQKVISNATEATIAKVKQVVFDSIKLGRTHKQTANALYQAFYEDETETGRNWDNVAITVINEAYNKGYLASLKIGEWVKGISMLDACPQCKELIDGKMYPLVSQAKLGDMDYVKFAPGTKEYQRASWINDNCLWVEKQNWGRRYSKKKRINVAVGNKKSNLINRPHHELFIPAIPLHNSCRCIWNRINVENSYVDKDNSLKMKLRNEDAWKKWYDAIIKPKIEGMKKYGLSS